MTTKTKTAKLLQSGPLTSGGAFATVILDGDAWTARAGAPEYDRMRRVEISRLGVVVSRARMGRIATGPAALFVPSRDAVPYEVIRALDAALNAEFDRITAELVKGSR